MTENQRDALIQETRDAVIELKAVILGANGQGGCYKKHEQTANDFYALRRWVIAIIAFSAGSGGAVGAGLVKLID